MNRGRIVFASLMSAIIAAGCDEVRPTIAVEPSVASTPAMKASAPAVDACPAEREGVLSPEQLDEAVRALVFLQMAPDRLAGLGASLGVSCAPTHPGFLRSLALALAHFQLRVLPFTHEVDGKLDARTLRFLAMIYPALRGSEHPCRSGLALSPPVWSNDRLVPATADADLHAGYSKAWIRELQHCLGQPNPTGRLDPPTLQNLAAWQKIVSVVDPSISVDGRLDDRTLAALKRAYPRLQSASPAPTDPEGYLPACVLQWKGATNEERTFLMQAYEAQRIWAAQRRTFVGMADAEPIEDGRTAQRGAAGAARQLLSAARASRADSKPRSGGDLRVIFGYRSSAVQVAIWEYHFPERYRATRVRREKLSSGPHGFEAVVDMAKQYAAQTAAPGYSLHNRGLALDLACTPSRGNVISPTGRFISAWKTSWCYSWLEKHAKDFGFYQNSKINEPWHWEFRPR